MREKISGSFNNSDVKNDTVDELKKRNDLQDTFRLGEKVENVPMNNIVAQHLQGQSELIPKVQETEKDFHLLKSQNESNKNNGI